MLTTGEAEEKHWWLSLRTTNWWLSLMGMLRVFLSGLCGVLGLLSDGSWSRTCLLGSGNLTEIIRVIAGVLCGVI